VSGSGDRPGHRAAHRAQSNPSHACHRLIVLHRARCDKRPRVSNFLNVRVAEPASKRSTKKIAGWASM
jgi:hypothetical protein